MTLPLGVVLTVLGVAVYLVLLMLLIAWASGWTALARRFPVDDTVLVFDAPFGAGEARFRGASMSLYRGRSWASSNYGGIVTLTVGSAGIGLRVPRLFLWHKPVFIPWSAVGNCSEKAILWIFRSVRVELTELKLTLSFQGKGSRELLTAWRRRKGIGPANP